MQNKGFVKVFAVLLTLVCVFYLSFSFVTRHYNNKAKEIANGDMKVEQDYLDSLSNEKVWLTLSFNCCVANSSESFASGAILWYSLTNRVITSS